MREGGHDPDENVNVEHDGELWWNAGSQRPYVGRRASEGRDESGEGEKGGG
jgi:hypothetical protein